MEACHCTVYTMLDPVHMTNTRWLDSGTWSSYCCWSGSGSRRFRRRVGVCPLFQPVATVPTMVHPPSMGDSALPNASSNARELSLLLSSPPCLPLPRCLAAHITTLATRPVLGPAAHTPPPASTPSLTIGAVSLSPRGATVRVGSTLLRRPLGIRVVGALPWGSAT